MHISLLIKTAMLPFRISTLTHHPPQCELCASTLGERLFLRRFLCGLRVLCVKSSPLHSFLPLFLIFAKTIHKTDTPISILFSARVSLFAQFFASRDKSCILPLLRKAWGYTLPLATKSEL